MSLSKKILLYFIFLAIIAVGGQATANYYFTRSSVSIIVNDSQKQLSEKILGNIDHEISERLDYIEFLSNDGNVNKLLLDKKNESLKSSVFSTVNTFKNSVGKWDFIFVLDSDNKVLLSTDPNNYVNGEVSTFVKGHLDIADEGKTYISDLVINSETNLPNLVSIQPVFESSSKTKVIGKIVGGMNWSDILERVSLDNENYDIILLNKQNLFIGDSNRSNDEKILKTSFDQVQLNYNASEGNYLNSLFGQRQNLTISNQKGHLDFKGFDWSLVINQRESEKYQIIFDAIMKMTTILLFLAFFVILALHVGTKKFILNPLLNLTNVSNCVAKGDYTRMAAVYSNDEFGILAKAFNNMVEQIKNHNYELEQKVKEKTSELAEQARLLTEQNDLLEKNRLANIELIKEIDQSRRTVMQKNINIEEKIKERTFQLKEEQTRLIASINSMPTGFLMADTKGAPVINNIALTEILNHEGKTLGFHDFKRLILADFDFDQSLNKSIKECIDIEKDNIRLGTKIIRIHIAPIKMHVPVEEVIGAVVLIADVTEEKIFERSKDEFFAVASHELRTPLTAIKGNTDMILSSYAEKINNSEVLEMLRDIKEGSERLIGIVNDFLEVARLEQGKVNLKIEDFSINDIVCEYVKDLEKTASDKNIKLYCEVDNKVPKIRNDKNKVGQVLMNLIGNAIKFTEKGKIKVSTEVLDNFVKISVSDTGSGIAQSKQSLLFRKFQPAGEEMLTRDVTKSTGLGLYISKLIIGQMGGSIGLEKSETGKGSTFSFTLPI